MENNKAKQLGAEPVSPVIMQKVGDDSFRARKEGDPKEYQYPMAGLTKREHFAAMAMQGILANAVIIDKEVISNMALQMADALLTELSKEHGDGN